MAFYNVRARWQAGNLKFASFGMDFETPVELDAGELQDIANTASTEWLSNVGLFATDVELQPCTVQGFERVEDSAGPPPVAHREPTTVEFVGTNATATGTVSGQSSAPQVSLVVTLRSASPQRRARGRVYTPPPPESVIDGAGLVSDTTTRVTMVSDLAAAVEGALAPVDIDHVIFSTRYGDQNEVISYTSDGLADTQRRRKS